MKAETVLQVRSDRFEEEVIRSRLPVVADFYADWCGPCRIVSPVIEQLSQGYSGKVKFVKIDTDDNQDLAMRFDIMSIPTVMVFSDGQVKSRVVGAAPSVTYKQKIDSVLKTK
jgi:thioredoxin 1